MSERPKRIQRKRTKGWKMPENTVYVGRGSKWGNPWRAVERNGHWHIDGPRANPFRTSCGNKEGAALVAIECFRSQPEGVSGMDLAALSGKNLACWCALNQPCHADVLLELANADPAP
jgi:hypothetical protein